MQKFSCDIQEYLEADLLLGVHGAGLTHMVATSSGVAMCSATVIVIPSCIQLLSLPDVSQAR